MGKKPIAAGLCAAIVGLTAYAHAAPVLTSSLSAWKSRVASWAETTDLGAANNSPIVGFNMVGGGFTAVNSVVRQIGHGWVTWSGGYAGQILADYDSSVVAFAFNSANDVFGFFAEPNPFSVVEITLETSDGSRLTQAVNGDGGAAFFGWTGGAVNGFTLSSVADFGVGDFYSTGSGATVVVSNAPEPTPWAMIILGLGGLGVLARRARRAVA